MTVAQEGHVSNDSTGRSGWPALTYSTPRELAMFLESEGLFQPDNHQAVFDDCGP